MSYRYCKITFIQCKKRTGDCSAGANVERILIMKKSLLIAGIAAAVMMSSSLTYAATNTPQDTKTQTKYEKKMPCKCKDCKCKKSPQVKRQGLDERLNLTEEQKQKAHEIRMNGHEKMKPVFEKMKAKKAEIKEIAESDLSQAEKEKKAG